MGKEEEERASCLICAQPGRVAAGVGFLVLRSGRGEKRKVLKLAGVSEPVAAAKSDDPR